MRGFEHAARHFGHAAELARQRPFGTGAVTQHAAEHLRPRGDARDLLDLGLAIDREEAHAECIGTGDVTLLLDRVAVGQPVGRGAGGEHLLDLDDRGGVEAGAHAGQQVEHLRGRVRLHGVEHARVGQGLGEGSVVVPHHVQVEDHARAVFATIAEEFDDTVGHGGIPLRRCDPATSTKQKGLAAIQDPCPRDGDAKPEA